eukprot:6214004-Amphidinium_carterae.3
MQVDIEQQIRAQQFSLLRTIMQPSWDSTTKHFTRQYYKWLEDINRYESENRQGSITDHVKIATYHQSPQRTSCTTYDAEGQQYDDISRSINGSRITSTAPTVVQRMIMGHGGGGNNEDEEHNEYYMIPFNKWMKGKGK